MENFESANNTYHLEHGSVYIANIYWLVNLDTLLHEEANGHLSTENKIKFKEKIEGLFREKMKFHYILMLNEGQDFFEKHNNKDSISHFKNFLGQIHQEYHSYGLKFVSKFAKVLVDLLMYETAHPDEKFFILLFDPENFQMLFNALMTLLEREIEHEQLCYRVLEDTRKDIGEVIRDHTEFNVKPCKMAQIFSEDKCEFEKTRQALLLPVE